MEEMKNKHVSFENSAFLEMSLVIPEPRTNKKKVIMRRKPSTERLTNRQKTSYDLSLIKTKHFSFVLLTTTAVKSCNFYS